MSKIAKSMAVLGVVAGLGVAALPLSTYAAPAQSGDVTVQVRVDSSLAVASDAQDGIVDLGVINAGTPVQSQQTKVTVSGTGGVKYKLTVEDKDANTALSRIDEAAAEEGATTEIPALAESATLTKGTSAWGVKGGEVEDYVGVKPAGSATPVTLVADGSIAGEATDQGQNVTDVTFGVAAGTGLANGTYQDTVVFIAAPSA